MRIVAALLIAGLSTSASGETAFSRLAPAAYADGVSAPAGADRPNPRTISNALNAQESPTADPRRLSDFVWQWGQFIDHDLVLTETDSSEPLPIAVTDPDDLLAPSIPFNRSANDGGAPREQINDVTPALDASMVYGSTPERTAALRTFSGGRLRTSAGDLLPFNTTGLENDTGGASESESASFFVGGDIRVNEQPGLTAMHTLFVREHNRLADAFATTNPDWPEEDLFRAARGLTTAAIAAITLNEYLPALLGSAQRFGSTQTIGIGSPPPPVNISNSFATAFFRLGHTQVSPTLRRVLADGSEDPENPSLPVSEIFFNPTIIADPGELEIILRGMTTQVQQRTDLQIIDDLRNALFGAPGAGGMDLAAINIQRGRDHGLPDFNTLRAALGLPRYENFAIFPVLESVYSSIDDIDPWIGALAEPNLPGSSVGETIAAAFRKQFSIETVDDLLTNINALLAGLETENGPSPSGSLAAIILRNTKITTLPQNVFFVPDPSAPAPVLHIASSETTPSLSWDLLPDFSYQLFGSTNLKSWSPVDELITTRFPRTFNTTPTTADNFFRIERIPLSISLEN